MDFGDSVQFEKEQSVSDFTDFDDPSFNLHFYVFYFFITTFLFFYHFVFHSPILFIDKTFFYYLSLLSNIELFPFFDFYFDLLGFDTMSLVYVIGYKFYYYEGFLNSKKELLLCYPSD